MCDEFLQQHNGRDDVTYFRLHVRILATVDDFLEAKFGVVVRATETAETDGGVERHLVFSLVRDATHGAENEHQLGETLQSLQSQA